MISIGEGEGLRARIIGEVLGVTNIAVGCRVYLAVRIGGHDGLQVRLDFGRDKMGAARWNYRWTRGRVSLRLSSACSRQNWGGDRRKPKRSTSPVQHQTTPFHHHDYHRDY